MNKTFNDPNTRYSDQGTPLAQAADALNAIGDITETVDELAETVDELSEKVDLIPVPVAADDGKVLTATDDGAYELADVEALPAIASGDAGKVLTVNAGETGAEWAAPSGGITLVAHYSASSSSTWASTDRRYNWTPSNSAINDENFVFGNYLFIVTPQTNDDFYSATKPFFFAGVTTRSIGSNNYTWTASFERIYGEGITQTDISMKPSVYIYKLG